MRIRKGKSNFRKELKTAFFTYALVPVIIVSLLLYLSLFFSLYLTRISENRGINRALSSELKRILDTYRKAVWEIGRNPGLLSAVMKAEADPGLYEDLYTVSRQTEIGCLFHVLTADLRVVMSNTTRIPWYASKPDSINLGNLKAAAASAGKVITEINKHPVDDNPLPPVTVAMALEAEGKVAGFLCMDLLYNDVLIQISRNPAVYNVLTDQFTNIAAASLPGQSDRFGKLDRTLQRNDHLFNRSADHRFVSMNTLENCGLSVLTITYTGVEDRIIAYTGVFLIVLFLVMAWILSVSAKGIVFRKTAVIDRIVDGLRKVRKGDLDRLMHIESPEEFRIIGEAFNRMLTDIKRLIAVNAEQIKRKSEAEIRQLESRFNPHFLFNTLETIRYMIPADAQSAGRMILNLSSLLRYSISNEKARVQLAEDMRFIAGYLAIQKCRFTSRFLYEVQIDEEAMPCYIPRLVVQPLIENSLKHGFGRKESLSLHINGKVDANNLVIDITDNGCGIPQEKLLELKLLLEYEENASGHHGLFNVHRRIRLMYGLLYGLQLESEAGGGTHIRLTLPAVYTEADT